MEEEVRCLLREGLTCLTPHAFSTSSDYASTVLPHLVVNQVGVLSFPVQPNQGSALIRMSTLVLRSPQKKHAADNVSSFHHEIEKSKFSCCKSWNQAVEQYAIQSAAELGFTWNTFELNNSKIILFEPGATFSTAELQELSSQTSAIVVVQLPSFHEGGAFIVREGDSEHVLNFCKWSERKFHWVVLRIGYELRLKPISQGFRVCVFYELVSRKSASQPPLYHQPALHIFSRACDLWERLPYDRRPFKFFVPLANKYETNNDSYTELKGEDVMIARHLLECDRFTVSLLLLEKEAKKGMGPPLHDKTSGMVKNDDKDRTSLRDQKHVLYRFEERFEPGKSELKAVRIYRNFNDTSGIEVKEKEIVDLSGVYRGREKGFGLLRVGLPRDKKVSDEKRKRPVSSTSQGLPKYDLKAALVLWPKAKAFSVLCEANFVSALQFLKSSILIPGDFATPTLRLAIDHVSNSRENLRKYTTNLLEFACDIKSEECAVATLKQMSTTQNGGNLSVLGRRSISGCSSERQVRAVAKATTLFEWNVIGPEVKKLIGRTHPEKFSHCSELVYLVRKNCEFQDVVNEINTTVLNTFCSGEFSMKSIEAVARLAFSSSFFGDQQRHMLERMKKLPNTMITRAVQGVSRALEENLNHSAKEALQDLVKEYLPKAITEYGNKTEPVGNRNLYPYLFVREAEGSKNLLVDLFGVVLRLRYISRETLTFFVTEVLSANHTDLLRALVKCKSLSLAVDEPNVRKLIRAAVEILQYPKPKGNYRQPKAFVPNHPQVTEFFHGNEPLFIYKCFAAVKKARAFIDGRFYGKLNKVEQHSASAEVVGRGSQVRVILRKTQSYYLDEIQKFERDQGEALRLRCLLEGKKHQLESRKRQKVNE